MKDKANLRWVSAASYWEVAIKVTLGKIQFDYPYSELRLLAKKLGFEWLPIEFEHTLEVTSLPLHHRDPFDRMLISQAMTEKLISSSPKTRTSRLTASLCSDKV